MPSERWLSFVLTGFLLVGCLGASGCDSPTAPGEELVGTWILISTTETDAPIGIRMVLRKDGTFKQSLSVEGITLSVTGTWEIVGDKLITVFDPVGGEVQSFSEEYTVRDGRLTLVDDKDGSVEIWERERSG